MRKVRAVLRLKAEGLSNRQIGRSLHMNHRTVGDYLLRAKAAGLGWPLPEGLDDEGLEARLFPARLATDPRPVPNWAEVDRELRKKGVTLMLLWVEYRQANPDGYQYVQFCNLYRRWKGSQDVVMRQRYKAGEKAFVDYAGQTVPVVSAETGEIREAQIFIGVLGCSNHTYAEATWSQMLPDWIGSHIRMYEFWGKVPEVTVPDNLKSGVKRASYYEPDVNPTYHELAEHYGTVIIPARQRRPRDRAKVEAGVLNAERWILARLRKHTFFSLAELNREIRRLLVELNNRPFQKMEGTRQSWYETLDKPAMKPLPPERYEFAEWKQKVGVNIDYHVQLDWHLYSVPYRLARQTVDARLTATMVEIFHRGRRVAAHRRSRVRGGCTTLPEHMPKAHRKHLEWTPSRLIRWAEREVGPQATEVVGQILKSKPHPEQGYRACLGLMRLARTYGAERLEAACRRVLRMGSPSYSSVASILKLGLDREPLEEPVHRELPAEHENLRGPAYYAGNGGQP